VLAAGFLNPGTLAGVVRSDQMYASGIERELLVTVGLDLLCVSTGDSPVLAREHTIATSGVP
jgi:hypothetical protein